MAADSDGCKSLTTVVTCEGDLSDPSFHKAFEDKLGKLNKILGEAIKVRKLEPWNSVRVTLSIPREAALRLRKLASEGSQQLRALGILSVQVEGDQVISLRIASSNSEPQEVILQTVQDEGSSSAQNEGALSRLLASTSGAEKVPFKSPNVVCPADSVVPKVPVSSPGSSAPVTTNKTFGGPFPFTSMNQAIHAVPPPPYPGKSGGAAVNISSPLLVNLLQNDGTPSSKSVSVKSEVISSASSSSLSARTAGQPQQLFLSQNGSSVRNSVTSTTTSSSNINSNSSNRVAHLITNPVTITNNNNNLISNIAADLDISNNSNNKGVSVNVNNKPTPPVSVSTTPNLPPVIPKQQIQISHSPPTTTISQANMSPTSALLLNTSKQNININNNSNNSKLNSTIIPNVAPALPPNYPGTPAGEVQVQNAVKPPVVTGHPPPPPYTLAVNHQQWDGGVHGSPFLDLTPSLTDLKADDLDDLLPTLERDLARSPPEIPEELTHQRVDRRKFLINPLTGELEPQSSGESEVEELGDVFTGLPSPAALSDDDTNSTIRPDTTDQSDSETLSHSDSGKHSRIKSKVRDRGRDSPVLKPTEKIKLRLKLEKTEPINSAYKVDVSFIQQQQPKKASASSAATVAPSIVSPSEELRVPPLHISLRGRNHAFITNKKKNKLNPDGSPGKVKVRKTQQKHLMADSSGAVGSVTNSVMSGSNSSSLSVNVSVQSTITATSAIISNSVEDLSGNNSNSNIMVNSSLLLNNEAAGVDSNMINKINSNKSSSSTSLSNETSSNKKVKKLKAAHQDLWVQDNSLLLINNSIGAHFNSSSSKDKQKERRGSDSDLAKSSLKLSSSRMFFSEKKRRLSQTEIKSEECPPILGSTNVGTIAGLPQQKTRKDKSKLKDGFKSSKELTGRSKSFTKSVSEKFTKQVALPTGDVDMEAKFKQRLMEEEKGVPRPPHRTDVTVKMATDMEKVDKGDQVMKAECDQPPLQDKSPEPDKCNTPDRKPLAPDPADKQSNRSPNSGAQGEDSGIESMDALSEKSPNQASQSPHADIPEPINKSKTQVPDILDIEAQLAKMEGLNGVEDLNDNQNELQPKLSQCCELTSALQDSLSKGAVSLSSVSVAVTGQGIVKEQMCEADVSLVPLKVKTKEDDMEPLPVRVTPPLYTYSNPEKSHPDSPALSDDDQPTNQQKTTKSLLEQLLIEIPPTDGSVPSSPSPATRSVRTRALSKLNSPELNSPVAKTRSSTPNATTKRKRHESDSSTNSLNLEEARKKPRKCSENAVELIKACMGGAAGSDPKAAAAAARKAVAPSPTANAKQDESSDSDEPLIEKVRKTTSNAGNSVGKGKVKKDGGKAMNTRRSVRASANPTPNTRSKGEKNSESEALRRKTRSTVSEGENKRKKEVK